jgi:4'-phosphopantetheinyl transferase
MGSSQWSGSSPDRSPLSSFKADHALKHALDRVILLHVGLLAEVDTPRTRAVCMGMLSPRERERAGRFRFEQDKRRFLLSHGLVRAALSRLVPAIHPTEWCFEPDRYGRPMIAAPLGAGCLYFSLSHTQGCVACVVSPFEAVGVDVEEISTRHSLLAIAEYCFSSEEVAALREHADQRQPGLFFDYWTLKEAYVKARGRGVALPLDRFSIRLRDGRISIAFAPGFEDHASRWRFMRFRPSPCHALAIAEGVGEPTGVPVLRRPWPLP